MKIDTDVFYSGNDLVREISSGKKFDLIYMDIQMENGDGITAAKNIRKKDEDAMIILFPAMTDTSWNYFAWMCFPLSENR